MQSIKGFLHEIMNSNRSFLRVLKKANQTQNRMPAGSLYET